MPTLSEFRRSSLPTMARHMATRTRPARRPRAFAALALVCSLALAGCTAAPTHNGAEVLETSPTSTSQGTTPTQAVTQMRTSMSSPGDSPNSSSTEDGASTQEDTQPAPLELWEADKTGVVPIPGLPQFIDVQMPFAITVDHKLVQLDQVDGALTVHAVDNPVQVRKLVPGGMIGEDSAYYLDGVQAIEDPAYIVDANVCLAADSEGAVWTVCDSNGQGGFDLRQPPAQVQGLAGVVKLSPPVLPDMNSALTADGSAYAWGDLAKWLPGCVDSSAPVRLEGGPTFTDIQGLFATDASGQMWTWIGVGQCMADGTVTGAEKLAGPRHARVSAQGAFFSEDGTVWATEDEFDSYKPVPGILPTLQQQDLGKLPAGKRIVFAYKGGAGLLVVQG